MIVIDMIPALFGWNYGKITRQGHAEWCGMDAAAILAFKGVDGNARLATEEERANVLAWLKGHDK